MFGANSPIWLVVQDYLRYITGDKKLDLFTPSRMLLGSEDPDAEPVVVYTTELAFIDSVVGVSKTVL